MPIFDGYLENRFLTASSLAPMYLLSNSGPYMDNLLLTIASYY